MIPITQTITRTGTGYDARTWRGILTTAWRRVGLHWHRMILGKHFTVAGYSEYMYTPRSVRYEKRKAATKGHRRPLVFRGQSELQAKRTRDLRVSSKGVNVVLHMPTYFYQYRKDFKSPDKAAELRMVSQGDAKVLATVMDHDIQRQIDADRRTVDITAGHRR